MKGYKIHYKNKEGLIIDSEWFEWNNYDNQVYLDKSYCEAVMEDAQEQFPDREFEIYEVEAK